MIKYGRKLIGATDPQKSEPGTIRGDLAVVVGRYCYKTLQSIYLYFGPVRLTGLQRGFGLQIPPSIPNATNGLNVHYILIQGDYYMFPRT